MREAMTTQRLSGLSRPPKGRKNSSGMINWLALCSYMRQPPDKKFVDYYSKLLCTSFRTKEAETFYLQGFSIYSVDPNYLFTFGSNYFWYCHTNSRCSLRSYRYSYIILFLWWAYMEKNL